MEKIQSHIKEQILNQMPALKVEFSSFNMPNDPDNRERFIVNCFFEEANVKLLDSYEPSLILHVNDKDRVRTFSRKNTAVILFETIPFLNRRQFQMAAVNLFLYHPYHPSQGFDRPARLYSTYVMLNEIGNKQFKNYRELFPYFCSEGSHLKDLYPNKPLLDSRLTENCCDCSGQEVLGTVPERYPDN